MGMIASVGVGLGLAAATSRKTPSYSLASEVHTEMAATQPATPEAPVAIGADESDTAQSNALMEAERNRERQQAALRAERGKEVFTSGLGATGLLDTSKKTLLGG